MKILHVTPSYWPAVIYGGPAVSITQLASWQVQAGAEVHVLTTTANGQENLNNNRSYTETIRGVKVWYCRRLTGDHTHFSPTLLWFLWKNRHAYDAIHVHSWWNLVSLFSVALLRILSFKRVIVSPRGMLSPYTVGKSRLKSRFQSLIGRHLLSKTTLHATSPQEATECQALISGWRTFIEPNYIALPEDDLPVSPDPFQLLFLARIDPKKGLERLFQLFTLVPESYHLVIAGTGNDQYVGELKKLAHQLGISNRIRWAGFVSGHEKTQLYKRSGLFILLSENENFGNAIAEALSCGVPVIVSDQTGFSHWVQLHQLGWVLNCRTDEANRFFSDFEERTRLAPSIRQTAPGAIRRLVGSVELARAYINQYQTISV